MGQYVIKVNILVQTEQKQPILENLVGFPDVDVRLDWKRQILIHIA